MMKYEKPDLEEMELALEGSFLTEATTLPKDDNENTDEGEWD